MAGTSNYDLIIIGGGINGAGIARDAAGRGLRVLLCEKDDLASATSSASTKLIHGGLRYLEHYEFRLVREALTEREVLLDNAPHIIWPLRFVLPHRKDLRPAWMIRLGLFLYDHLGGRKKLPASEGISFAKHVSGAPLRDEMTKGFVYSDCWVDDARLVVLNAMDAKDMGAEILTRTECVGASRSDDGWNVTLRDQETGENRSVSGRMLINAAGPWCADLINPENGVVKSDTRANIRLVKGSHIVVPKMFDHDFCYIFQNGDGRIVFAIPYQDDFTLIGTTDVDFKGDPSTVKIDQDEIDYLCKLASGYFKKPIASDDVVWTYSGVRPLYAGEGAEANASKVSRDYTLKLEANGHQAPALHVFGGKITTYRKLAEHALQIISRELGAKDTPWTAGASLPGGDFPNASYEAAFASYAARYDWMDAVMLKRLLRAYGTRIEQIIGNAKGVRDLGKCYGHDLYEAEVRYLIDNEWVHDINDLIWRRSKLGLRLSGDQVADLGERLAQENRDHKSVAAE
ncbi:MULTISPECIES: glycerol-3-phosphate dehydrogenase [Thalassospira]|uniref:Glycerol-3-phosphate dehydrogenase n=1 Tax=Thalassospira profundimaris TaxID=502049 RepID=A0A367V9G7_9PROT|nr:MULTISPECIES: glycerol-3-phosphate dehydrogenase [Thalassospira]KZB70459.1 glycerol-3-phosphate dehydrogenase [Thalassospira sp. MCCC 1A01148]MBR9901768.1 glycerol-3-phosphate dehydrogenase [Rhodospirillales bacterium]RCK20900.1 glycerol-3-phosphate dehydrogenase [Thalassospira profundimaris]